MEICHVVIHKQFLHRAAMVTSYIIYQQKTGRNSASQLLLVCHLPVCLEI